MKPKNDCGDRGNQRAGLDWKYIVVLTTLRRDLLERAFESFQS
jgi:hypothetical protein